MTLAKLAFDALSVHLGDKPFLMGDRPCGADAGVYGQVAGAVSPFFDNEFTRLAWPIPTWCPIANS